MGTCARKRTRRQSSRRQFGSSRCPKARHIKEILSLGLERQLEAEDGEVEALKKGLIEEMQAQQNSSDQVRR